MCCLVFVSILFLMVGLKGFHKFHFIFLNHFRHKDKISFLFFFKYSLLLSLYAHRKKESHLVLHEGLILFIEKYCKSKAINPTLVYVKRKGTGSETHPKRIKVEEGASVNKKVSKQERTKKHVEEITESENSDNNEKLDIFDEKKNGGFQL